MTEPSLAADAIFRAFQTGPYSDRCALAAALRAAASILQEVYASEQYMDHPDDFLLAIATELENCS